MTETTKITVKVDVPKLLYAFKHFRNLSNRAFSQIFGYSETSVSYYRTRYVAGKLTYRKQVTDEVAAAVTEQVTKYLESQPIVKERKKSVKNNNLKIDQAKVAYLVTYYPELTNNDLATIFECKYQTIYNYKVKVLKGKIEVPAQGNEEWDKEVAAYKLTKELHKQEQKQKQGETANTERLQTMPINDEEYQELTASDRLGSHVAELIIPPIGGIHKMIVVAEGDRDNASAIFNHLLQTFEDGEKYGIEIKVSKVRP